MALIPPTPSSISVPASSSNGAATVSWAASSWATSYTLQQQFNSGSWSQVYSGSATSKALSGLNDGDYVYRVQACNGNGCSGWRSSGTLTVAWIPAAPASITVPASSLDATLAVSWSVSSHASSYVLYQRFNSGSWAHVYTGSATSRTVTVSASGSYQYEVKACGAGGCSGYRVSSAVAVTLKPTAAPSLSGPSTSSSGTFTMSWSAVSGATRYQLNQSINGGAWQAVYNGTGRSWSSSGLGNGSYAYKAYGWNAAGWGPASSTKTVVVTHPPATPAWLSAPSNVTLNVTFAVSWAAVSGTTSYTLQQTAIDTGTVRTKYTGPGTSTTTSIGLPGYYQFAVKACNSGGCSGWRSAGYTDAEPRGGPRAIPASGSTQ